MTQDDLIHTFYSFYCIPETKLVPKHVSFVQKYELPKLTSGDLTLTFVLQVEPKSVRYASLSIVVVFCIQIGPKTCIAWPHWGNKYGDLWWPDLDLTPSCHKGSQWSQRALLHPIKGLPLSMKPIVCFPGLRSAVNTKTTLFTFDLSLTWPLTWNLNF